MSLLRRRRRQPTGAQVKVLPDPRTGPLSTAGPVKSIQEAEIEMTRMPSAIRLPVRR